MKNIKIITAFILAMSLTLSSAAFAAETAKWTTATTNSRVDISEDNKQVVLQCASTSARKRASCEAVKAFSLSHSDGDTLMSFKVAIEDFKENQTGTISIKDDKNRVATLIKISNATLTVMNDDSATALMTAGEPVDIDIMFNVKVGNALIKIGESSWQYTGNTNLKALYEEGSRAIPLNLAVRNYTEKEMQSSAKMTVSEIELSTSGKFAFEGIIVDGKVIGPICDISSIQNGITVAFKGNAADEMYDYSNYAVTIDGEPAEFSIEKSDSGMLITLLQPLHAGREIAVTVRNIKDKYGVIYALDSVTAFRVADEGYEMPTISVISENTEFYVGQAAKFNVSVGGTLWESIKIYVNNSYKETVERETFTYNFSPETQGNYTLKFVVEDKLGSSDSEEIAVTFLRNDLPILSFAQYSNGERINVIEGSEGVLDIQATDDVGIDELSVYINGVLYERVSTSPYRLDLSELPLGTSTVIAEARDIYGRSAKIYATVVKTKKVSINLFSESTFNEGSASYASGMTLHRQRGFVKTDTVDEEHGTSMIIGMDENCDTVNFTPNQYTFAQHTINLNYTQQIYEFDVNVINVPKLNSAGFNFAVRYDDGTIVTLMSINKDRISIPSVSVPYTKDTWYHLKINLTIDSCNIVLADPSGNETVSGALKLNATKIPDKFRFYTTGDAENLCSFAVDNITTYSLLQSLVIKGVGSEAKIYEDDVPHGLKTLYVHTEGKVLGEDVNVDNVSLFKGAEKVILRKVKYSPGNGLVELQFDEPLFMNAKYRVEFSGNMRFNGDAVLGEALSYGFSTKNEGITVKSVKRSIVRNDLKAVLNATNLDDKNKTVYIFMNKFSSDGRLISSIVFKHTLPGGGIEYPLECVLEGAADSNVQIFLSDAVNVNNIFCVDNY